MWRRWAMNYVDLFAGIGGFALGAYWAGWRFDRHYFSEIDPWCCRLYQQRFPDAVPLGDIRAIDGESLPSGDWVITGGFPCQDISYAGHGLGIKGERSGLWFQYERVIREVGPKLVIVENVPALLGRGMGEVLGSLSDCGYDAEWSVISGCSVGAPHVRRRVFIVAHPYGVDGWKGIRDSPAQSNGPLQKIGDLESARAGWKARLANPSALYGGANGLSDGMDRNRGLGNSIVPQIAELIFRQLRENL